jgi:hypothetical protein
MTGNAPKNKMRIFDLNDSFYLIYIKKQYHFTDNIELVKIFIVEYLFPLPFWQWR